MIRIILVEDHPAVRYALSEVLAADPGIVIAIEAESAEEALRESASRRADVAVIDIRLPAMSGLSLIGQLKETRRELRTLVLTGVADEETMLAAFAAGADGFALKESEPALLRLAVRSVAEGGVFVDPRLAGRLVAQATHAAAPPALG